MSIQYVVDQLENYVHVQLTDTLSSEDAIDFEADLIKDKRVQPGFSLLFDASDVRLIQIDRPVVNGLLEMEKVFPDKFVGARRAFVFNSEANFSWAIYFKDHALGRNFVDVNLDKARAWLRHPFDS